MTISEQLAHLQGLAEGMEIASETSKEARLLTAMLGVLSSIADQLNVLEEDVSLVSAQADDLAEDVMQLQDELYDDDEEDDWSFFRSPGGAEMPEEEEDFDEFDEEEVFYEVKCPECGAVLTLDEDTLLAGNIRCESCGQLFSLELVDEEDESADYDEDDGPGD